MPSPLRVSVIVTTRDRPAMLAEAVASVLAQVRPADELIVVDDGIDNHKDTKAQREKKTTVHNLPIRCLRGPGHGPGAARNVGLQAATGDLIAFLDDDDLWLPQKLAWQVEWFERRPRLGLLGGMAEESGGSVRTVGATPCVALGESWTRPYGANAPTQPGSGGHRNARPTAYEVVSRGAMLRANRLGMSSVLARRECLGEGFDESLALAQDWDMWLRVAQEWEVGVVPAPLFVYRKHEGQRSADRAEMRRWEAVVIERALARGEAGDWWLRGVGRRRLAWAHGRLGRILVRCGETQQAWEELRESMNLFRFNPVVWAAWARCALAMHIPARVKL